MFAFFVMFACVLVSVTVIAEIYGSIVCANEINETVREINVDLYVESCAVECDVQAWFDTASWNDAWYQPEVVVTSSWNFERDVKAIASEYRARKGGYDAGVYAP